MSIGPLTVLLAMLLSAPAARDAGAPLVVAARVYHAPHAAGRPSTIHLYRLGSDGSGMRQITHGPYDDGDPLWSPDGRKIAFLRDMTGDGENDYASRLCVINSDGTGERTLLRLTATAWAFHEWSPDGRSILAAWSDATNPDDPGRLAIISISTEQVRMVPGVKRAIWSPDSRRLLAAGSDVWIDAATGAQTPAPGDWIRPFFLDANTLADTAPSDREGAPTAIRLVRSDGTEIRRVAPKSPTGLDTWDRDRLLAGPIAMAACPGSRSRILYYENRRDSTVGVNYGLYVMDLTSGALREIGEGQFLAWSPDGRRFVTAPGRSLGRYGKKSVWVAPLTLGTQGGGKPRPILGGTVWVTGADWRKRS